MIEKLKVGPTRLGAVEANGNRQKCKNCGANINPKAENDQGENQPPFQLPCMWIHAYVNCES
jgi:hypothetical protein